MKWIYELAAALFFAATGYLAAGAAPDKTVGAVVGICLLLVGAVLLAAGLQGLLKKWQECRTAEQEQTEKHAAELKGTMDALQAKLQTLCESTAAVQNEHAALLEKLKKHWEAQDQTVGTIYGTCLGLKNDINTFCKNTQTAVGSVQNTLEDSAGRQEKAIGNLCKDMQTCLNNACDHAEEQQKALTGALQQVNEDNRTKLDQILKNYAQLTAQDVEVLKALGLGVEENDG